jgi:hypothetical protein
VVATNGFLSLAILTAAVLFKFIDSWGDSYGANGINILAFTGLEDAMDPLWLILEFL